MRNVVLTRVDERLIHGQVMTSWLKLCNANVILIIDAGSASNAFLKRILFAAAPKDVELQVMNEPLSRCWPSPPEARHRQTTKTQRI